MTVPPASSTVSPPGQVGFLASEKDLMLLREGCEEYHFALACRTQEEANKGKGISHCRDHQSAFCGTLEERLDELHIVRKLMSQIADREYVRKRDRIEEDAVSVVYLSVRSAGVLQRALLTHHSANANLQTASSYWRCTHLPIVLARLQELALPLMVAEAVQ